MNGNLIITIGRQSGSGGREIGRKLAEKMGIKCYDKELLTRAAKDSGLAEEIFQTHDEKPTTSFLYSLVMDTYSSGYGSTGYVDMPLNHKVFMAQFDTIRKIAKEESCVFIGRCADYALEDVPNVLSVFISGNEEDRIREVARKQSVDENKAKDIMIKDDKSRSSYYNYFTNKRWGDARSYDLCINSSLLGIDGTVEAICEFARIYKSL